jgi:ABC-type methionine transport system permease subunit
MVAAIILCVILVEIVQSVGNLVAKRIDKRTR